MKMIVLDRPGRLAVVETPTPSPGSGEVRIRVACAGICGSDVEVFGGRRSGRIVSGHTVLGHEVSGLIDALGPGVLGLRLGDAVTCVETWGGFADHVVARPEVTLRLPRDLDLRDGCLLEVMPGVMMAATRMGIGRTSDVLIVGQGLSGLLLTRVIALHGCRRLAVVDPSPFKLSLARELGATHVHAGTLETLGESIGGVHPEGFDYAVIATPSASPVTAVAALLRPKGRIVLYGGLEESVQLDLYALHRGSISIVKEGMDVAGVLEARALWKQALDLVQDGLLPLHRLRTHTFPMSQAQEAFELRSRSLDSAVHVVLENDWPSEPA